MLWIVLTLLYTWQWDNTLFNKILLFYDDNFPYCFVIVKITKVKKWKWCREKKNMWVWRRGVTIYMHIFCSYICCTIGSSSILLQSDHNPIRCYSTIWPIFYTILKPSLHFCTASNTYLCDVLGRTIVTAIERICYIAQKSYVADSIHSCDN